MSDYLNCARVGQILVHRLLHLLDPLVEILVILFELLKFFQCQLEQLSDAHSSKLRAAELAENLPQHRLVFIIATAGHLAQQRILST